MENNINTQEVLDLLLTRQSDLVKAVSTAQSDVEETVNNIDPINAKFLSEHNLKNYSRIIDCNETIFANVFKVSGNQTMDEALEEFRADLVDNIIVNTNPTYDYKRYSDPEKNNLVGAGTIVFNDFDTIEVDDVVRGYYQVKIVGDTEQTGTLPPSNPSNTIDDLLWDNGRIPKLSTRLRGGNDGESRVANNIYYVMISKAEKLPAGTTFELLERDGDEFNPTGMYLEIYYKTNNDVERVPQPATGHGGRPNTKWEKQPHSAWDEFLAWWSDAFAYVDWIFTETYPDGCVRKTEVYSNGNEYTYWTTGRCKNK